MFFVQFLSCVAQRLKLHTNFFDDGTYEQVNVPFFKQIRIPYPVRNHLMAFAPIFFFFRFLLQTLQVCFDQSAHNIVDTESLSEAIETQSNKSDSSVEYDTVAEYESSPNTIDDAESSCIENATQPRENVDFDQTANLTTNPDTVEPTEITVPLSQKRKASTGCDETESILKRRVSILLKRVKFDGNMNKWILPANTITIKRIETNYDEKENFAPEIDAELTAMVLDTSCHFSFDRFLFANFFFFRFFWLLQISKLPSNCFVDGCDQIHE